MGLFDALGLVLGGYTIYAAVQGRVYAKRGPWGEAIHRDDRPGYFWTVIAIYAGLSVALVTVF